MPTPSRHRPVAKSNAVLWIVLGSLAALGLCIGAYFLLREPGKTPSPDLPGSGRAALDPNDVESTRAWAAEAVKSLKAAESAKNGARTDAEIARVEKELKDALLGKQVRWAFPVAAVDGGEVKLDSFFGTKAGQFRSDDPKLNGKPMRRLHFRVFFEAEKDAVMVGDEVTQAQAGQLKKGSKVTVARTVTEITLTKHDDKWVSSSSYSDVVDVLEPYCVTVVVERK